MSNADTPVRAEQIAQIIGQGPQGTNPPSAPVQEAPVAGAATTPEPPATGVPPVAEPESYTKEFVDGLRREAAAARAQAYAGVQGQDRQTIETFARAVAEGNDEFIDNWVLNVARHRGLLEDDTPPAQTPYGAPPQPGLQQQPALTLEDVQRIADERAQAMRAEWEESQAQQAAKARIDSSFSELGVDPRSPVADSLRALGARLSYERGVFVPPAEVFETWKAQVAPLVGVAPASPANGAVPPVPPVGQPAHVDGYAGMKPEERALRRLQDAQQRTV